MKQKRNRTKKELLDLFEAGLHLAEKVTKELAISYKQYLSRYYALSSANFMLAAVNSFLRVTGGRE